MKLRSLLCTLLLHSIVLADLPKDLTFHTDLKSYVDNAEYYNAYREGVLLLGLSSDLYFKYTPNPRLTFSVGTHLKKEFGDEAYYSDIRPYLQSRYTRNGYSLIMGVLDTVANHGLPDAILKHETPIIDGLDEGIQMIFDTRFVYSDLWMTVHQLNTPEHREHLDFGWVLRKNLGRVQFKGMVYWDHYGGQLYAPEGDPVRENTTGSVEVRYDALSADSTKGVGGGTSFLGSSTYGEYGYGGTLSAWFMLNRFKTTLQVYKGNDFQAWRGNSMYQTNDIYYFVQLERTIQLGKNCGLEWGGRIDFVDIAPQRWTNHADHKLWAKCVASFDIPLFKEK